MTVFILIFVVILLIGLGFGAAIRLVFRRYNPLEKVPDSGREKVAFRWSYIAAPVVILLLSVALTVLFYRELPEQVGYHFGADGAPDRWLSRQFTVAIMLLPQVFLVLLSTGMTWGLARLGLLSGQPNIMGLRPQRILQLMGNIAVLPQVVLGFAMIDIFSYNSYQVHILPSWAFLLILGLVTAVLIVSLAFVVMRARRKSIIQPGK